MRDISEKRAVELRWPEVGGIVAEEIKEVLGLQVQCKVNVIESFVLGCDIHRISFSPPEALPTLTGCTGHPGGLGRCSA